MTCPTADELEAIAARINDDEDMRAVLAAAEELRRLQMRPHPVLSVKVPELGADDATAVALVWATKVQDPAQTIWFGTRLPVWDLTVSHFDEVEIQEFGGGVVRTIPEQFAVSVTTEDSTLIAASDKVAMGYDLAAVGEYLDL